MWRKVGEPLRKAVDILTNFAAVAAALVALGIVALLAHLRGGLFDQLVPEAIGVAFTVVVLDFLIRRAERVRTRPIRFAVYIESNRVLCRVLRLWANLVKASISAPPEPEDDLFADKFVSALGMLDLHAEAGMHPPTPWHTRLSREAQEIFDTSDRVIQRYQANIDGGLLEFLRTVDHKGVFPIFKLASVVAANTYKANIFDGPGCAEAIDAIRKFHRRLVGLSREFEPLPGYSPPEDIAFRREISEMRERNDIAPLLGSGRYR